MCHLDKLTLYLRLLSTSVRRATILTVASAIYCRKLIGRRPWEANSCSAIQKYPEFYGTQLFITVFTKAPYLPCPEADKSSPHTSYYYNFHFNIIFTQLPLSIPSGLSPSCFPTITLYAFFPIPVCHMSFQSHALWFCHPNNTWWIVPWSSPLCSFIQCAVISSFLVHPHIFLSTLLSNTLSLYQRPSFTLM